MLKRPVWSMPVVVIFVLGQDTSQVRISRRQEPIHRSMIAFARGARTGVLMVLMPMLWSTASKAAANLRRDRGGGT